MYQNELAQKAARTDYWWDDTPQGVWLTDNDKGMSLTNNAGAVLAHLEENAGVELAGRPIVYRDSQGVWDGMEWFPEVQRVEFIGLGCQSAEEAFAKLKER